MQELLIFACNICTQTLTTILMVSLMVKEHFYGSPKHQMLACVEGSTYLIDFRAEY